MYSKEEASEGLLEDVRSGARYEDFEKHTRSRVAPLRSLFVALGFALSLLGNAFLLYKLHDTKDDPELCRSKFSGLGYDTPSVYRIHTDYSSDNATLADTLWDQIDTSPIVVAFTDDYARVHGLDESVRFPWDNTKGLYHIKAFHHMHCLKSMRKAYMDAVHGLPQIVPTEHYSHCLDTLRQDLMCLADDTPMPTINQRHHIGNGQVRKCRNWEKLIEWTQEPERQSCFRMLDDYRRVPRTLEQFAYCEKTSKYYPIAQKYFEEYGHHNPYGDGGDNGY
jgi:hypothetical protein